MHKLQQAIKWTVYTLLIINFLFYVFEDWNRALHTLRPESGFLDWTNEFATSLDESAWFILLFMFELETYVLEDEHWTGWVAHTVRGARLICFAIIAHTVFAFTDTVIDYEKTVPVENVTNLCEMAEDDVSYVYNLEYTKVTKESCASLSSATRFFRLGDDPLVTDRDGLILERRLAWADLIEAVVWLAILLAIEIVVRLQGRGVTGGRLITLLTRLKLLLYLTLILIGVYWASLSHWLYLWDELVWIGGFAAIEMNVAEWRQELLDK